MVQLSGIRLAPAEEEPLYRQLFDTIVDRIQNGTYPPGFRLPPTRSLAKELSVHRNTVVRTYEDLESAGFVESTVGRGTFVARHPAPAQPLQTPTSGRLPWRSLISDGAAAEPLTRADRLARTPSSPGTVILSRMQPSDDLLPHELLRRCLNHAMKTHRQKALAYGPKEGLPTLRELVAEDLERQGVPARAEELIITTGSQQGLDLIVRTLVNPGDAFLVNESTYQGALNLLAAARARMVGIPSDEEGPSLDALERSARAGVKGLYVMPNCQNPTGLRVSSERRHALVAFSHRHGIPLIEDDYASDLLLDGQAPLPPMRALDGDVVYLGTYSKKLIPALRIGYLLCPPALRTQLSALKHAMDLGTSAILQYALAEFLDRGYLRAHLSAVLPEYRKRRDALEEGLQKYLPADVQWKSPQTGLALWLPTPPELSTDALFHEAQAQGVSVAPGWMNAVERGQGSGLRLTFCSETPARLVEGAKRLGKAWATVAKRSRGAAAQTGEARYDAV